MRFYLFFSSTTEKIKQSVSQLETQVKVPGLNTLVSGRSIVGQQNATMKGLTCCVHLHGTTTMLALVAYSLKPVKI